MALLVLSHCISCHQGNRREWGARGVGGLGVYHQLNLLIKNYNCPFNGQTGKLGRNKADLLNVSTITTVQGNEEQM